MRKGAWLNGRPLIINQAVSTNAYDVEAAKANAIAKSIEALPSLKDWQVSAVIKSLIIEIKK